MSRIQGSRTFRLFVSSTFADFGAERDALQADVFPKLSALCAELGYRFQAIDLRWGIRTEAARDQATLDLCLKEVERCRALSPPPNFLLLLGDRYGWRPLPSRIDQCEYEELLALLTPDERSLVNWRRTESGEETGWYRLDENARPPSYVLLPRSATRLQSEPWPVVERRLWHAFQNAIAGSGWPESDDRRIKFEASATHQEVIKGLKSDGFAFIRTIDNFEDVSSSDFVDLDDEQRRDEAAMQRLRALQGEITHKLGSNVSTRHTIWSGSGLDDHDLESMCSDLVERLSRAIRAEVARIREIPREETERRAHREFASARRQLFCGRHHVLTALQSCLMSPDDVPVVIYGPMGAGKSALLAHVARLAEEMTPRTLVVYRSIGATPDSVDAVGLLKGVMQELDAGGSPEHRKNDYESLAKDCAWRLQYPLVRQVFILDALDQLPADSPARDFRWLPDKLLAKSNVIVSLSDHDLLQRLQTRAPRARIVEIGPLTDDEGAEMLRRRLEADGRALQPSQEAEVLEKFRDCRSPMFLALASEEARRWQSFDAAADNRIQRDIPSSIRAVIARFSEDREHGPLLVSRTLGYLSASRFGLSEDELADVLALDVDIRAEYEIHANQPIVGEHLPTILWSRLLHDLAPFITERLVDGFTLLGFSHRLFDDIVTADLLAGENERRAHSLLARFFDRPELWQQGSRTPHGRRALSELPYHQRKASLWADAERTLLDLAFIEAKCAFPCTSSSPTLPPFCATFRLSDRHRASDWNCSTDRSISRPNRSPAIQGD